MNVIKKIQIYCDLEYMKNITFVIKKNVYISVYIL